MINALEPFTELRGTGSERVTVSNTWTMGPTEKVVLEQMLEGMRGSHKDSRRMSIPGMSKGYEACLRQSGGH